MARFDDIKVGDQVVISQRHVRRSVATVERVTATQFVANGVRFTKHGHKVGESDSFYFITTVQLLTPELLAKVAVEQRYGNAFDTLRTLENKLKTARTEIDRCRNSQDYTDAIIAANAHLEQAVALLTKQEDNDV